MKITTSPVPESGFDTTCPHCRRTAFRSFSDCSAYLGDTPMYSDGDTLPIWHDLTPQQRESCGWFADLIGGACLGCGGPLFAIRAKFMDTDPDEDTEDNYFHAEVWDPGSSRNFLATDGTLTWLVSRHDTPLGPMLEHSFGPFADSYGQWIGPMGIASCVTGGPWEFARAFLLERWQALADMRKGIGYEPGDPRALPRSLPRGVKSAQQVRMERIVPSRPRVSPKRPKDYDDDIPF